MKKIIFALLVAISITTNAQNSRNPGDTYTYMPEFLGAQDDFCANGNTANQNFYVSYEKVLGPTDNRGVAEIKGLAFLITYTTELNPLNTNIPCKTAATKAVFNKRTNTIEIVAVDNKNEFNWNGYRQDGNFANNEIQKRITSYVPMAELPLYQSLPVVLKIGGAEKQIMLYNDPRNFILYVYEDLYQVRKDKKDSIVTVLFKNVATFARGTDEESLAEPIYHVKSDGTRILIK